MSALGLVNGLADLGVLFEAVDGRLAQVGGSALQPAVEQQVQGYALEMAALLASPTRGGVVTEVIHGTGDLHRLAEICRDVMMSAQPPIRLHAGCATCTVTGRRCTKCLDLSRSHKGNAHVYVDPRFCFFFMLLWYCNKLEYVVRSHTRTWLDNRGEDETFKTLCCALQAELEPAIAKMHSLFVIAKDHVLATLRRYAQSHQYEPVLRPVESAPEGEWGT